MDRSRALRLQKSEGVEGRRWINHGIVAVGGTMGSEGGECEDSAKKKQKKKK